MKSANFIVLGLLLSHLAGANNLKLLDDKKIYECTLELFSDQNGMPTPKKVQRVVIDPPANGYYTDPVIVAIAPEYDQLKQRKHFFTYYYPSVLHKKFRLKLSVSYLDGRQGREQVYSEAKNADSIRLVASKPNAKWDPSILECTLVE